MDVAILKKQIGRSTHQVHERPGYVSTTATPAACSPTRSSTWILLAETGSTDTQISRDAPGLSDGFRIFIIGHWLRV